MHKNADSIEDGNGKPMDRPYALVSIVLALRLSPGYREDQPPRTWWGRAAHSLLLDTIRHYEPALAESLHGSPGKPEGGDGQPSLRPFTASTLMGRFPNGRFDDQGTYTLRLTSTRPEITAILLAACRDGPLAAGSTIELDHLPFSIRAIQPAWAVHELRIQETPSRAPNHPAQIQDPLSPWAGACTYQQLGAPYLLARETAPRRISLRFASPATFKSSGRQVPLPLPELVFGSLLDKWNASAPVALPPEARRYAAECLAIGRFKLSSRAVPLKAGGLRFGAVGEATYTSLAYDRYWMSVMATLAAFALYGGVGAATSMGLGQCRVL